MKDDFTSARSILFTVGEELDGKPLLVMLKEKRVSHRLITKLKRTPMGMTRNGLPIRTVDVVHSGDIISLAAVNDTHTEPNPTLDIPVVYEDESVVVFDKPIGVPVHPSYLHQGDTLGNFFAARFPQLTFRPVNRLDRDTSGLCCVAKSAYAASLLQGSLDKLYSAVVCGAVEEDGVISAPIGRQDGSIIGRTVREDGQPAVTEYTVMHSGERYSLLEIKLHNGRTHQIRVHLSHIGFPLAGDSLYGGDCTDISAQALHCSRLRFVSPHTGGEILLSSPIREDMAALLRK